MPTIPNRPNMPGGGWRQQRAAQLRAGAEAEERIQRAPPEGQAGLGNDRLHCVREGETLESIADVHNCSPESIRNHPDNAVFSAQDDPASTLAPGDNVYIPTEDEQPPQPVGQGEHVVNQGECISSIAKDTGHFWETIWNDPANEELKEVREKPNILLSGDRVTIPEKRRKEEPRETEQRHRFVRRGEPAMLRLRVLDNDEPRRNHPYMITIDGHEYDGLTDADGVLECPIPGNARRGKLVIGEDQEEFELNLGAVDPIEEVSGVQHRLNNLEFDCGTVDGLTGAQTQSALRAFQEFYKLEPTGQLDQTTRDTLLRAHRS